MGYEEAENVSEADTCELLETYETEVVELDYDILDEELAEW